MWATTLATFVSGVGYAVFRYALEPSDPFSVVAHPLEPWLLRAHVLVSPLLVFALGMVSLKHVWKHFRGGVGTGRRTGTMTMLATVPMIASGYLIQVITHVGWLRALVIGHLVTGTFFLLGIAAHQWALRRRRASISGPSSAPAATRRAKSGRSARPARARSFDSVSRRHTL